MTTSSFSQHSERQHADLLELKEVGAETNALLTELVALGKSSLNATKANAAISGGIAAKGRFESVVGRGTRPGGTPDQFREMYKRFEVIAAAKKNMTFRMANKLAGDAIADVNRSGIGEDSRRTVGTVAGRLRRVGYSIANKLSAARDAGKTVLNSIPDNLNPTKGDAWKTTPLRAAGLAYAAAKATTSLLAPGESTIGDNMSFYNQKLQDGVSAYGNPGYWLINGARNIASNAVNVWGSAAGVASGAAASSAVGFGPK